MNRFKKVLITLASFLGIVGIAFATFLITQTISTGNSVQAESASLTVVNTPFSITGLVIGGSTAPNALTITNTGTATGTLSIVLSNATGSNCAYTTLNITGSASGSAQVSDIASINLGTLAAGATDTLSQVASLSNSGVLGGSCTWDEKATLSGN